MSLVAVIQVVAHLIAPAPPATEPAIVRTARFVASSGLVCLVAQARLPMGTALEWLAPLGPIGVAGYQRLYLTFEGTPIVLMYDRELGASLGIAPPHLLWPMVARRKLFARLQGDWRAWGVQVQFHKSKTRPPGFMPIGYETVLVRGNLLCYGVVGEPPVGAFSFLVTAERRCGVDIIASSYPCRDDRDELAARPTVVPAHFRRAVVPVGPVVLTACLEQGGVELSVWCRPAR